MAGFSARTALTAGYLGGIAVFVCFFLFRNLDEVARYIVQARTSFLLLSYGFGFAYFFCNALLWVAIQQRVAHGGTALGPVSWLRIFIYGYLGKYIPGKVALIFGRILFLERHGYSKAQVVVASSYEVVFQLLNAGCIVGVILPLVWLPGSAPWRLRAASALLALAAMAMVVFSPALEKLVNRISGQAARDTASPARSGERYRLRAIFLGYTIPTALAGVVFFCFLNTLVPLDPTSGNLLASIAIVNLAGVAGTLVVFAPSGIGVREGVLAFLLVSVLQLDGGLSVFLSVVYRVFVTTLEALFVITVSLASLVEGRIGRRQ